MQQNEETPEIPEEIRKHISNAKRHHYIPEFLLRRFSTNPIEQHPLICLLDVDKGAIKKQSTLNCAVIQHYNRLSTDATLPSGFPEAMLSSAEGQALPVLEKLISSKPITDLERLDFSIFVMLQQTRTPRGRGWQRFSVEQAAEIYLIAQIEKNSDHVKALLQEDLGREPTETEVKNYSRTLIEALENDYVALESSYDAEILGMFTHTEALVPLIASKSWTLLRAPKEQHFILSDEPLLRHDPVNPHGPAGWGSSNTVEITLPLDPQLCLLLHQQSSLALNECHLTAEQVLDINLRTYASAREYIYGPHEQLLESIHGAAKTYADRVEQYRPTPPTIHLRERIIGEAKPFKETLFPGPRTTTIRRNRSKNSE